MELTIRLKKGRLLLKAKVVNIPAANSNSFLKKTLIIIISVLFSGYCLYGQTNYLLKKNDATFDNISLEEAFNCLTKKTGCQFSFNANLLPLNKKINQKFYNKTLLFILSSLLSEYDVGFKEIKNQIIIYQLTQINNGKSLAVNSDKKGSEMYHIINIYDTIRKTVIDTFEYVDTVRIQKFDTIKVYDTITIVNTLKSPLKKIKYPHFTNDINFSGQFNFFQIENKTGELNNFNKLKDMKKPGLGFSLGSVFTLQFKKFLIESGLYYNLKKERYNYSNYLIGSEMVWKPDSAPSYTDTRYYFDSAGYFHSVSKDIYTYFKTLKEVPKIYTSDYHIFLYYHFLQIPLMIGYKQTSKKDIIEFKGGIYTDIFLFTSGRGFFNKDSIFSEDAGKSNIGYSRISFSLYLDFSYNYYINRNTFFLMEFFYYQNLSSIYDKTYWYSQKFGYPGIKLGIRKILQ